LTGVARRARRRGERLPSTSTAPPPTAPHPPPQAPAHCRLPLLRRRSATSRISSPQPPCVADFRPPSPVRPRARASPLAAARQRTAAARLRTAAVRHTAPLPERFTCSFRPRMRRQASPDHPDLVTTVCVRRRSPHRRRSLVRAPAAASELVLRRRCTPDRRRPTTQPPRPGKSSGHPN
jgi:hypothetical protein